MVVGEDLAHSHESDRRCRLVMHRNRRASQFVESAADDQQVAVLERVEEFFRRQVLALQRQSNSRMSSSEIT